MLEKCKIVVAEGLSHILLRWENSSELIDKSQNFCLRPPRTIHVVKCCIH